MNKRTAYMLLAHGTREPAASQPVHRYAQLLSARLDARVEPCLREFIEPSVPTVVGKLVAEGFEEIRVITFFLFKSGHVTRDIEADLAAEKAKYPHLRFCVSEPLGTDELLVSLLEKRAREILG